MDVAMEDAADSDGGEPAAPARSGGVARTGNGNAKEKDARTEDIRVDAKTALLALEKLEAEMKSVLANKSNPGRGTSALDSDDDGGRAIEMYERVHLLASIIEAFLSRPLEAGPTPSVPRSVRVERLRESIHAVKALVEEAETKLGRWEKTLVDVYERAARTCAPELD